jgi:hypothetical protein
VLDGCPTETQDDTVRYGEHMGCNPSRVHAA